MDVRRAGLSDQAALIEFTSEEFREAENSTSPPSTIGPGIRAALEDESKARYWLLVDEADNPVGHTSAVTEWSDWNAGFYWWIQSMYITPAHRGQGLAQQLLDAVMAEMRQQGGLQLRLYVNNQNASAIKAYHNAGFVKSVYDIMICHTAIDNPK